MFLIGYGDEISSLYYLCPRSFVLSVTTGDRNGASSQQRKVTFLFCNEKKIILVALILDFTPTLSAKPAVGMAASISHMVVTILIICMHMSY